MNAVIYIIHKSIHPSFRPSVRPSIIGEDALVPTTHSNCPWRTRRRFPDQMRYIIHPAYYGKILYRSLSSNCGRQGQQLKSFLKQNHHLGGHREGLFGWLWRGSVKPAGDPERGSRVWLTAWESAPPSWRPGFSAGKLLNVHTVWGMSFYSSWKSSTIIGSYFHWIYFLFAEINLIFMYESGG